MRRDNVKDARVVSHDPELLREFPGHHCIEYCTDCTLIDYLLSYTVKGEPTFGLKPDDKTNNSSDKPRIKHKVEYI